MPLKVTISKKISKGYYKALGSAFNGSGFTAPAEVLIKEVTKNKVQLVLDSSVMVSKINNKEVVLYINPPIVEVPKVSEGTKIEFSNFQFEPKK